MPDLSFSIGQEEVGAAFVFGAPGPVNEELATQSVLLLVTSMI